MAVFFYIAAGIAILTTALAVTRANAVHALMYLVVSLLSVAFIFYTLGAPFVAGLEIIVYAGAIVVLLVFAVMLLNEGPAAVEREREWTRPRTWIGPSILGMALVGVFFFYLFLRPDAVVRVTEMSRVKVLCKALYGPYLLGVEAVSFLLLAGLVGAYHVGKRERPRP